MPFIAPDLPFDTEQKPKSKGFIAPDLPDEALGGEDVASKLKNDQDFAPTPEEIARGYKSRFALPDPAAFWEGAKHFVTETLPQQAGKAYDQTMADGFPNPISPSFLRKQALTGAETALRGTAYFGDMLANPLNAGIGEAAAEAQSPGRAMLRLGAKLLAPNLPVDTVLPRTPEQQSAAEQIWASRTRVAGKDARAMTPYHEGEQSFVPGAMPAVAELGSNFVDPTLLIPAAKGMGLLKMAGKGAEAASIGEKMARVAEEAGNTGGLAKKAVEVAAPAAEKAAQAAGRGAELVGEGLDKVQPILDVGGLIKGGLPGAAGAHVVGRTARAAVKWASKVRDASTGLRNVAKADWNSSWTVAQQLAKDADAPAWLKRTASSSVAPAVESTIRGAGAIGEGALHGAAIGGAASMANDTLTSQERGEAMGAGGVLGAGGAALGRGIGKLTGRTAAAQQAHDQAVMSHEAIQGGADPASVFAASDATMYYAHSIKQLFKGAMPGGKDLAVRLLDGKQFGEAHPNDPGAVASFRANPDGTFEALINLDRPEADSRVLHEALGHALLESVVGNNPDAFERARSIFTPEELGLAGEQYATALHPELKGPDQQTWIAQQQANSLNKWGDRDAWILSELISEGAVKEAGGRSIRDMATPGFGMSLLRSVDLDKPLFVDTTSFFRGPVATKLTSPELGAIVRGRVEELGRFRPGIDQPKENSITIQKGDWGKKPFAPLHDLAKVPAQPPPLPRDPSQPPPLNPPPPTKPPTVPKGNDFVVVNPTTGAVIPRPPAQTKQLVRNRQKAVDAAVPKDVAPAPIGDADTQVKLRTSPSGLLERSGTTLGKWFYDGNVFSETTKNYARKIEEAIKSGTPLSGFYHEIGESARGWAKSVAEKYGNLKAEYKDFIPVGFLISNAGNLLMRNYSLTAYERKAQLWGSRKGPLSLEMYNGDLGEFRKDVQTYMRNHAEGRPGSDGIGEQKRDLINAFMVGGNRSFEATNPLRPLLRGEDRAGLVRSYRLDRLETIEPSEVTGFAKPSYEKQLRNLSPKVGLSPQDEIAGKLFGLKYSELFPGQRSDVDAAVAKAGVGKPKGQTSGQVKTPEFKQWFGDWEDPNAFSSRRKGPPVSVVVDSRGQPLTVFHSTRGDFTSFETGRKTANNYGFFGNADTVRHAIFFTDSPSQADGYSKTEGNFEKGSVSVPVFLDIKSPIDFTNSGLDYEQLASELGVTYNYLRNSLPWEHLDGADGKQFVEDAKRAGYDGMLFHEDTLEPGAKPGTTYAVFDPTQIKSAIGNQGTFDPKNPDIRFSPKVGDKAYLKAVENKDLDAAKRMVELAAKKAGYGPDEVAHGTTHMFTVFTKDRSNIGNDFGKGHYFSSTPDDVAANYAGEGPDLTQRIELLAEQLESNEDMSPKEARVAAEKQLKGTEDGRVIKAYVRLDNPAKLGGKDETRLHTEYGDGEDAEPTGSGPDFLKGLEYAAREFDDVDGQQLVSDVLDNVGGMLDGQPLREVLAAAKEFIFATDPETGDSAGNELLRSALEHSGYDGIVDRTVNEKFGSKRKYGKGMDGVYPDTYHVIAFDSNQIKSSDPVTYDDKGKVIPLSKRFDPTNPDIRFSPRVPKDEREVILNLTSATGTLPGLDRLTREASGGDANAEKTLNGITHDALHLLMSGVAGVRVDIQDTRGVFGSSFEPAVQAVVRGTPESVDAALAAAERFARNFNQQEIHRRESSPEGHYPGREHGDGSFDTPVFTFTVNRALTPGDITHLIEVSGLDALTQRGDSLEAYYANDPKNLAKIRQFERGIEKLADTLGDNLQSSGRTSARLWRYGTGENGTIPYERIRGDVRPEPTQQNAIAKRIAERLRGREVSGAPQAKEITTDQQQLQTRIAKEFEAAPMNELGNPVVAKAYRELADELVTQYEHLPVKIEVLTGQGEPYKSSAEMRKDVAENNHLFIFGTTPESFGPEGVSYKGHPLLEDSGFKDVNGKPLLKNDLLQAVHDYYAHTITPVEFGPKGEEAAWKNHMQMTKSPWARLALTTETRGQNSAVNFGKNAEFNKANKKDTIFADQKVTVLDPEFSKIGDPEADAQIDAIADQVRGRSQAQFSPGIPQRKEIDPSYLPENERKDIDGWMSTAVPTSKDRKGLEISQDLVVTGDGYFNALNPEQQKKLRDIIAGYPGMGDLPKAPAEAVAEFKKRGVENLLAIWDATPDDIRSRSKLWYVGGRAIVDRFSKQYGVTTQQAAAAIAALSPQKGWQENVRMAEMMLDAVQNLSDKQTTPRQIAYLRATAHTASEVKAGKAEAQAQVLEKQVSRFSNPENKAKAQEKASTLRNQAAREKAQADITAAVISEMEGKTFGQLKSDLARAMWIRSWFDGNVKDKKTPDITPEGNILPVSAVTETGKPVTLRWQGYGPLKKVLQALKDDSRASISKVLGGAHKVRNFYNNLLLPNLKEMQDVTVDTHAVAAALFRGLGAADPEVGFVLGGSPSGGDFSGNYGLYADMYREAAAARGALPREMQSVTWEALRNLMTGSFKSRTKDQLSAIWKAVETGELTREQARKRIIAAAGGWKPPSWYTHDSRRGSESIGDAGNP